MPETARAKGQKLLRAIIAGIDPTEEKRAARKARQEQAIAAADRSLEAVGGRWIAQMRLEDKRSADEVERNLKRHVYPEYGAHARDAVHDRF